MEAIEDKTSIDWARVVLGIISILNAFFPSFNKFGTASASANGANWEIIMAFWLTNFHSSWDSGLNVTIMSACFKTSSRFNTGAPTYSLSETKDSSPAPASIITETPNADNLERVSGTMATRGSLHSFTIPTFIFSIFQQISMIMMIVVRTMRILISSNTDIGDLGGGHRTNTVAPAHSPLLR